MARGVTARWERADFARPPIALARALLGQVLVRTLGDGTRMSGRIVEVEAYLGVRDRAAHSFGGRRTARNASMYAGPGTAYVYFTYGMHHCVNVVCGREGEPVAVLIRAIAPVEGIEAMRAHRAGSAKAPRELNDRVLCAGPARVCQALRIDRGLDGLDLCASRELWIERGPAVRRAERSPRIGVAYAREWAERPLRFVDGSQRNWVSRAR